MSPKSVASPAVAIVTKSIIFVLDPVEPPANIPRVPPLAPPAVLHTVKLPK